MSLTRSTLCLKSRNQTFLDSGGRNKSNSHEHDVHHVLEVGIKRFWFQEAGMSLSHFLVGIGEMKIFDELAAHHV